MRISYKNNTLEKIITSVNIWAGLAVAASFIILLGFDKPLLEKKLLYSVQMAIFFVFIGEKVLRFFNTTEKKQYLRMIWFEFPLLTLLLVVLVGVRYNPQVADPERVKLISIWVYLVFQTVDKACRTIINITARSANPMQPLIISFILLILIGSGLLMLPKSHNLEGLSYIDSLFTATSATCVTGLIVKDTGADFTVAGQTIILTMIQLGGLGIMIFGAVFALIFRQAFSITETAALQDILSSETAGKIGTVVGFIFTATVVIETVGAFAMFAIWQNSQDISHHSIFSSIFHSISAFCNAGFGLCQDSLMGFRKSWQVYAVVCPLIILGGFGFSVLYDISKVTADCIFRFFRRILLPNKKIELAVAKRINLQTKIVLTVSCILILVGAFSLYGLEWIFGNSDFSYNDGLFQSITARTAGFNTVDIKSLSPASKIVLMILMFIGGSPGSTAGGIKTITLAVIVMAAWSTIRKRSEVEIFNRSIRISIVGKAITVFLVFGGVLILGFFALMITEKDNGFGVLDVGFEAFSAIGTVGLTTGITSSLTTGGKIVIIILMLIGRLGPLTFLASLTFNLKPKRYNYPNEALIVG